MPESVQASSSKEIVPYEAIAQPVTVAGGSFGTPEALNNALRRWSIEFPRDVYINLLNEAVSRVTEVIEQHENSRDRILINMYELGRETLGNDFSKFKRTTEYRHIWFKVTTALKNAKKNQNSTQTARQTVINQWGDDGRRFLEFNSAQGWTKAAGRLARACPEYIQATNYIVNAIFDRLNNMRSGRSLALRPGLTDLQTAITFSKQPNPPQPVSENELKALGVQPPSSTDDVEVEAWEIATSLRGISPHADAVILARPYLDLEVQAEMDILLGGDRHLAWDMVLEWRTIATRHVKQQFQLWLHIENNMYGLQSYPLVLDASGEITAWDSGAKGKEPEAAGPSRSGGAKRGTRDLSPRKSPSKRPQSSGGGFFKWLKKR